VKAQLKPQLWLPVTVFLAVSLPLVWLLNALAVGGDHRVWLAIAAGALATGYTQSRLAAKEASSTALHGEHA
jgi:4-hydroxybenzoate polyprenyltransferase